MTATATETELRHLQPGDRLKYYGVQWHIRDYSTYTDPQGYETEEWLLKAGTGKAYYLLREVDSTNLEKPVAWYIAEELRHPTIVEPGSSKDLLPDLAKALQSGQSPYPELQVFNRVYLFESRTEGTYESEGETTTRITWDYWDQPHLWNLALEAWSDRSLVIYSTREVQPTDFSEIQHAHMDSTPSFVTSHTDLIVSTDSRTIQLILAWALTIVGFFFMLAGI